MKFFTSTHQNNIFHKKIILIILLLFVSIGCHLQPEISRTQSALNGIQTQITSVDKDHWKITLVVPIFDNDVWDASIPSEPIAIQSTSLNKDQSLSWELSRERWEKDRPFEIFIKNKNYSGNIVVSVGGTFGRVPDALLMVVGHVVMR